MIRRVALPEMYLRKINVSVSVKEGSDNDNNDKKSETY